jgi:hypothetical protein
MEKLVRRKLEVFPEEKRQIVGARLMRTGDKDGIEVASCALS